MVLGCSCFKYNTKSRIAKWSDLWHSRLYFSMLFHFWLSGWSKQAGLLCKSHMVAVWPESCWRLEIRLSPFKNLEPKLWMWRSLGVHCGLDTIISLWTGWQGAVHDAERRFLGTLKQFSEMTLGEFVGCTWQPMTLVPCLRHNWARHKYLMSSLWLNELNGKWALA